MGDIKMTRDADKLYVSAEYSDEKLKIKTKYKTNKSSFLNIELTPNSLKRHIHVPIINSGEFYIELEDVNFYEMSGIEVYITHADLSIVTSDDFYAQTFINKLNIPFIDNKQKLQSMMQTDFSRSTIQSEKKGWFRSALSRSTSTLKEGFGAAKDASKLVGGGIKSGYRQVRDSLPEAKAAFDDALLTMGIQKDHPAFKAIIRIGVTAATGGASEVLVARSAVGKINAIMSKQGNGFTGKISYDNSGALFAMFGSELVPVEASAVRQIVETLAVANTGMSAGRLGLLDNAVGEHVTSLVQKINQKKSKKTDVGDTVGKYFKHHLSNTTKSDSTATNMALELSTALDVIFPEGFDGSSSAYHNITRKLALNEANMLKKLVNKINGDPNINIDGTPDAVDIQNIFKHISELSNLQGIDVDETLKKYKETSGSQSSLQSLTSSSMTLSTTLFDGEEVTTTTVEDTEPPPDQEAVLFDLVAFEEVEEQPTGEETETDKKKKKRINVVEVLRFEEYIPIQECDPGDPFASHASCRCDLSDKLIIEDIFIAPPPSSTLFMQFSISGSDGLFGHFWPNKGHLAGKNFRLFPAKEEETE